ncbi:hypothetical protein GCM10023093_17020 [Nemorincola caseinilytica]|uniref:Uncharacterized protein n=1 Tax=Nemorincola caseinilytica TaxID=2054315 RepID=A0ABP8ND45_9BACT
METVIEMYAPGCDTTLLDEEQMVQKLAHIRYERERAAAQFTKWPYGNNNR